MSHTREMTIWCDWEDGEQTCHRFLQEAVPMAKQLRKAARSQGWVHREGLDYCPEHADHESQ